MDFGQKEGIKTGADDLGNDATKIKEDFDEDKIEKLWISVTFSNWYEFVM